MPQPAIDRHGMFLCVRDFLALHHNLHPHAIHHESRLIQDLGVDGQKAVRLMNQFRAEFGVDLSGFHFDEHFCPPAAFGSWAWIGAMLRDITGWQGLDPARPMIPITVGNLARSLERKRLWTEDLDPRVNKSPATAPAERTPWLDPVSTHSD
jgi:hypothetical protein